jgi:hypothetical protein
MWVVSCALGHYWAELAAGNVYVIDYFQHVPNDSNSSDKYQNLMKMTSFPLFLSREGIWGIKVMYELKLIV